MIKRKNYEYMGNGWQNKFSRRPTGRIRLIKPRFWKFPSGWSLAIPRGGARPENLGNKLVEQNEELLRFPPMSNEHPLSRGTVRRERRKSRPNRRSETDLAASDRLISKRSSSSRIGKVFHRQKGSRSIALRRISYLQRSAQFRNQKCGWTENFLNHSFVTQKTFRVGRKDARSGMATTLP